MSDRLAAAQLRLIADQLESGEAEITDSYFRFTPPATTRLEMTVELVSFSQTKALGSPMQLPESKSKIIGEINE